MDGLRKKQQAILFGHPELVVIVLVILVIIIIIIASCLFFVQHLLDDLQCSMYNAVKMQRSVTENLKHPHNAHDEKYAVYRTGVNGAKNKEVQMWLDQEGFCLTLK